MRKRVIYGWRWRHCLSLLVGLLAALGAAACIPPEHMTMAPLQPPPPAILDLTLIDTQWRLDQVSHRGQMVAFDATGLVHLVFDRTGGLEIHGQACGSGTYAVAYLGGPRYQLANPTFLGIECSGAAWMQFNAVVDALEATSGYDLSDAELVLRGAAAELRLVKDNF